jgi:hypothetical protein
MFSHVKDCDPLTFHVGYRGPARGQVVHPAHLDELRHALNLSKRLDQAASIKTSLPSVFMTCVCTRIGIYRAFTDSRAILRRDATTVLSRRQLEKDAGRAPARENDGQTKAILFGGETCSKR